MPERVWQQVIWPTAKRGPAAPLGRQCFLLWLLWALWTAGLLLFLHHQPAVALLTFLFYFAGACGTRQYSVVAAGILFAWYILGEIGNVILAIPIGWADWLIAILLASTIRVTWVARQRSQLEQAQTPLIASDRILFRCWRGFRYPFWVTAALLLSLNLWGTVAAMQDRKLGFSMENVSPNQSSPSR